MGHAQPAADPSAQGDVYPATIGLYHGPLYAGDNGYESYGPYARYVHEFARRFREVVVFGPVTRAQTEYRGCSIEADNVRVVELPPFSTHVQAARHFVSIFRTFRREIDTLDVINCRHVAPFGYLLYFLARSRGVGFLYHYTSDPWEILSETPRYRGVFGLFARTAYAVDFAIQKFVLRRTYGFVNGRLPYERLRRVTDRIEPIISSTLTADDLREPAAAALHQPIRLLYVGYLKHMKGLEYLIDAVRRLVHNGMDVELSLVGTGPYEGVVREKVQRGGLSDRVRFSGYVVMGDALNRHYDEADIFVFPSLSEGSPRVVLEALAHGLPTVSTRVGSVTDLIEDGRSGLLVDTRDAEGIAAAITRYVSDDSFRHECAAAGFVSAKEHTVERFVGRIASKAAELVRGRAP